MDEETMSAFASLIGKKMKENYLMTSRDAVNSLIKELREFDMTYGELIDKSAGRD